MQRSESALYRVTLRGASTARILEPRSKAADFAGLRMRSKRNVGALLLS
jgi:hypothetical protein